jgi:hypothetical protein
VLDGEENEDGFETELELVEVELVPPVLLVPLVEWVVVALLLFPPKNPVFFSAPIDEEVPPIDDGVFVKEL